MNYKKDFYESRAKSLLKAPSMQQKSVSDLYGPLENKAVSLANTN